MAQSVKSLVYKHKDLSLSPQLLHKKSSVALVILIVGWRQMDLSSSLPARLAELQNTRSAGDTGSWGTIPEVDLWLPHGCSFSHTSQTAPLPQKNDICHEIYSALDYSLQLEKSDMQFIGLGFGLWLSHEFSAEDRQTLNALGQFDLPFSFCLGGNYNQPGEHTLWNSESRRIPKSQGLERLLILFLAGAPALPGDGYGDLVSSQGMLNTTHGRSVRVYIQELT